MTILKKTTRPPRRPRAVEDGGGAPRRPRATEPERRARLTEALLLALVLLVMLLGGALGLLAKKRTLLAPGPDGSPPAFVNLNTADAPTLAKTLAVGKATAARIVAAKGAGKGAAGFADVDALGRIPVVPKAEQEAVAAALEKASPPPAKSGPPPSAAAAKSAVMALPGLDTEAKTRLLALRAAYPETAWRRLVAYPLLPPSLVSAAEARLVARDWDAARRMLLVALGAMAAFFVLAHLAIRYARPGADPFLLPLTAALASLGVLLLWGIKDPLRDMPTFAWQAQGAAVGGALTFLVVLSRPFARLRLHRYGYLYAVAAVLGTVVLGALGSGPGGVRLTVAGTQPVEVIKVLMVLFLAAYLAERADLLDDPTRRFGPFPVPRRKDVAPLIVLYALPLALFSIVRDLGPVLLLFGAFLLLVYLATGRGVYVALGVLALLAGGWLGYALKFGVFETRVDMWLSPWDNAHANGDQVARGLWGLASGGLPGSGLGLGGSRFIPRGGSDLAFASLGEETGPFGCLAVILCFLALAARGQVIARRAGSDFDRLLASGLSGLLALQALIITAGTLGLLPLTGITLPFVSYGKSSLVASFLIVALLLMLSARAPAQTPGVLPSRAFVAASRRVAALFIALFAACAVRLMWVQVVQADQIATRPVRVPDADGVKRAHVNPRLLALADRVPRGRLLDRAGTVLAVTRSSDGKRVYPLGPAFAHLVGYADPAVGGPTGLEEQFGTELRGFENTRALLPLWRAKDLPGFTLPKGRDVVLSLDARLQQACLDALKEHTAGLRDRRTGRPKRRAAAVVLDARTGEVLAAVTTPSFDPNTLTPEKIQALRADLDDEHPLINRATAGLYPPGSTFKIVTASALFDNGLSDFTYVCNHVDRNVRWRVDKVPYARARIVDDEGDRPHGLTNLTEAIAESCNVYFGHAGLALGPKPLRDHAARYGIGRLPTAAQFAASLPDIAYGQGEMLVTPLEMAGVAQTVANGGKRLKPQFVKGTPPALAETLLTPENAARLAAMMREVTRSGTAGGQFESLPFSVAGKTGTAQNDRYDGAPHSWFIGFAPADDPKVAFAVVVENGGYGSQVAVPVACDILRTAVR